MRKKNKKQKSLDFMKTCLLTVAVLLIIFTAVIIYIFNKTGEEPSTLVTCFFATFSFELIGCVCIKVFKLKYPDKNEEEDNGEFDR